MHNLSGGVPVVVVKTVGCMEQPRATRTYLLRVLNITTGALPSRATNQLQNEA